MLEIPVGSESLGQTIEIQLILDSTLERSDIKKKIGDPLKRIKMYKKSNLYRFIPSENKSRDVLMAKGTDHPEFDSIYAFNHPKIFARHSLLPVEYLFNYGEKGSPYTCMIAVYDGTQFINDEEHHFIFKNSGNKLQALKAVIFVSSNS